MRYIPQFKIKSLLLGTAVCALIVAFVYIPYIRNSVRQKVIQRIESFGGKVFFEYQQDDGKFDPSRTPPGPRWARNLWGDDWFAKEHFVQLHQPVPEPLAKDIAQLSDTKTLSLKDQAISDSFAEEIGSLSQLERLMIFNCILSPKGLASVSNCENLKSIYFQSQLNPDGHLAEFPNFSQLEDLTLGGVSATDRGIECLRSLTSLKHLRLIEADNVTDQSISVIKQMTQLEELVLWRTGFTSKVTKSLASFPNLRKLELDSPGISDSDIESLENLKLIEVLKIRRSQLTDDSFDTFSNLENLSWLVIPGTRITDDGLARLQELPNLENLEIMNSSLITNSGLESLAKLTKLRRLLMTFNLQITKADVDRLKTALPNCRVICFPMPVGETEKDATASSSKE